MLYTRMLSLDNFNLYPCIFIPSPYHDTNRGPEMNEAYHQACAL
uniref:Uncharacterized protein n=1 Tax=Setaria italica TaxID=4555 RepID=K3Z1N4_SETIT